MTFEVFSFYVCQVIYFLVHTPTVKLKISFFSILAYKLIKLPASENGFLEEVFIKIERFLKRENPF